MARLLRLHFASVGHPDARLAPLTLDFRARDGSSSGTDSVLWLRNGGGKSTILNLFYSVFRTDSREFLGAKSEARARSLTDYVKAEDLAFVVTEWDVDPPGDDTLFGKAPTRRRVVGQVLAWRDHQKSADPQKLRRKWFSFVVDDQLPFEGLPIEGLGPEPVRTFEDFRDFVEGLKQTRPELEPTLEESHRRWADHLEKIGLDPELFKYQLVMNQREGSADEAFRFSSVTDFIRFYFEIALDPTAANKVSEIVAAQRDKVARRPALLGEQAFLVATRRALGPLVAAVLAQRQADQLRDEARHDAAAAVAALGAAAARARTDESLARQAAQAAREGAQQAGNDAARLGRYAGGFERRALELDLSEAEAQCALADQGLASGLEALKVAEAAVARDHHHEVLRHRDAKALAAHLARQEREPQRRHLAAVGARLRALLLDAAGAADLERQGAEARERQARAAAAAHDKAIGELKADEGRTSARVAELDRWFADRDRDREALRADGTLHEREEAGASALRWRQLGLARREAVALHAAARDEARAQATEAQAQAVEHLVVREQLDVRLDHQRRQLQGARRDRDQLFAHPELQALGEHDLAELDGPRLGDLLRSAAALARAEVLRSAVDGAEDDRALGALDTTGRLPASPDVERALQILGDGGVVAYGGGAWLAANAPAEGALHVGADPARWHGVIVPDAQTLARAQTTLADLGPRAPLTLSVASLTLPAPLVDRCVIPGDPAHFDLRAGQRLRERLDGRRQARVKRRAELEAAATARSDLAARIDLWRAAWGDGKLDRLVADLDLDQTRRDAEERARVAADLRATDARSAEKTAEIARSQAEAEALAADRRADRAQAQVDRYERFVDDKRRDKDVAKARIAELVAELAALGARRDQAHKEAQQARDGAQDAQRAARSLRADHDTVDVYDQDPAAIATLAEARPQWVELRAVWERIVSEDRLQWELDQAEEALRKAAAASRKAAEGRAPEAIAQIPDGQGQGAVDRAQPALEEARQGAADARSRRDLARDRHKAQAARRREADDLPKGAEGEPPTAAAARERAEQCRLQREASGQRRQELDAEALAEERRGTAAAALAERHEQRQTRLRDAQGDEGLLAEPSALPEPPEVEAWVEARVRALRAADLGVTAAAATLDGAAEDLRLVALDPAHDDVKNHVKDRLKAPTHELSAAGPGLAGLVDERLEVVAEILGEIEKDRQMILKEVDQVAYEAVKRLKEAETASKMPEGLEGWEGEPFLRIGAEVPAGQAERISRLEAVLERWVHQGQIPSGRRLVEEAVQGLAPTITATILKPDTIKRRDRLPITDMQTFSRGQQLTVAIVLYCTLARLRAAHRGRSHRSDAGVLLLDNPVGTCSSVPLLDLQRAVARKMRVQLVYATGVDDLNALATFPNIVRMRNAHLARRSGDQHVTVEGVEALRIVAR